MFLITAATMLVSCQEETLDPLTGKYAPPEVANLTVLDSQTRDKDGSLFVFSVNLKDEASNTLKMILYAADYSLPASDYTPSATAVSKTYLTGSNGSAYNGVQISSGTISIALSGSNYTLEGILYLADETVVKMTGAFSVVYEYIPLYTYSETTETPALGGAYGSTPIAGTTKHKITVYSDGVMSGYYEVVTASTATSLSGTYAVKGTLDAEGQAAQGIYFDWSWYGWSGITMAGCYYLKNGDKQFIRETGNITIVDNGSTLSITGNDLKILDLPTLISSKGATTQNLADAGKVKVEDASKALANVVSAKATDLSGYGLNYFVIDIKIPTSGVTATYNSSTWSWDYTGSGNLITLEFKRSDASLPAGIYNVVSNSSSAIGDCIAGYQNPYGGTDIWASSWSTITNGAANTVAIISGKVEVIKDGSNYIFIVDITTNNGSVKTTYNGPLTIQ